MQSGLRDLKTNALQENGGREGELEKVILDEMDEIPQKKRGKTFKQQKAMCEALYGLGGIKDAFARREWHGEVQ